jgi:hypothetical protein
VTKILKAKAKAIAGAIISAAVAYIGTAATTGNPATVHGLELAAAAAACTFLGVHQVTNTE